MGSKNGVTRAAYVSGGAVQITSVSFPLRAVVLPVAGSPGFVLMSGPETEAFLGCVVVRSVGDLISSVARCESERLLARRTCPLPLLYLFHNSFPHRACAGHSGRDLGAFTWYRKNGHSQIALNEFDHKVNIS